MQMCRAPSVTCKRRACDRDPVAQREPPQHALSESRTPSSRVTWTCEVSRPSGERESGSYSGTRQRNRLKVGPSQESSSGQPKRTRRRRREIREEFSFLHERSSSLESSSREIGFGTRRAPQLRRCPDRPLGP